jgi:hypothetical protein
MGYNARFKKEIWWEVWGGYCAVYGEMLVFFDRFGILGQ